MTRQNGIPDVTGIRGTPPAVGAISRARQVFGRGYLALIASIALFAACSSPPGPAAAPPMPPADLVFLGENILTIDPTTANAQGVAIRGDTIAAVGTRAEIERAIGPATRVVELGWAAEVHIGPEIMGLVQAGEMPFLGKFEGYDIMLIEFPDSHILPGTDKLVSWLLSRKVRPMIAHRSATRT